METILAIWSWLSGHKDLALELLGLASALAWAVAKATPSSWDNRLMDKVQWLLDLLSLSHRAKRAGEEALAANPPKGVEEIVGGPREIQ